MSYVQFNPEKHEYQSDQGVLVPSVTQIIAKAGLCDFSCVEEEVRLRSMARGTSVHWLLQLDDQGALNYRTVPIGLRPYRKAYRDWLLASGFGPVLIETPFISHYGYAGTIDRFGTFPKTEAYPNGSTGIVDIKTGEVQDWVRYQLVAYAMRMHAHAAIARTYRRIALALRADGTYAVKEFPRETWDVDWAKFIEAKRSVDAGHVDHERARD